MFHARLKSQQIPMSPYVTGVMIPSIYNSPCKFISEIHINIHMQKPGVPPLVGALEHVLFFHILGRIIKID